jgi:hypothetical protein
VFLYRGKRKGIGIDEFGSGAKLDLDKKKWGWDRNPGPF